MTISKIFTVTAHNSGGNSSTKVRIGVHPYLALPNIGAFNLPSNQNITPISTVATACVALFEPGPQGAGRLRFNVTPPLPPGPMSRLVLNRSTGIISGSSSMFFESTKKRSRRERDDWYYHAFMIDLVARAIVVVVLYFESWG